MKKMLLLPLLLVMALVGTRVVAQTYTYQFNGNLNEASTGPALTEVLSCSATAGSFPSEIINTTAGPCSGVPQQVFAFTEGGGLSFPNSNLIGGTYTINVFFKFNLFSGYQRILDFQNGQTDDGLYSLNDCLNFYPNGNVGTCPFFVANNYYLLTLVRDNATDIITIYFNGTSFGSYNDAAKFYVSPTTTTPIIFFRDNIASSAQCEDRDGSIKYLSLTPSTSTPAQVATTYSNICAIALPLNIISFAGQKENNAVALNWKTVNEVNVNRFDIERSADGNNFSVIDNVVATNSQAANSYTYTDRNPIAGNSFYRLKIIDRDGRSKYSSIIKINFAGLSTFQVYPNPAQNEVVISGMTRNGSIKMMSADGKVFLQKTTTSESMSLNISSMPKGIYIVEYTDGTNIHHEKLIKN